MNYVRNLWPGPKFRFLAIQFEVSTRWYKHCIHTFGFVNLFPMKIYQNYCREETDADQCYRQFLLRIPHFGPNAQLFKASSAQLPQFLKFTRQSL
jgi:hypothetical protein